MTPDQENVVRCLAILSVLGLLMWSGWWLAREPEFDDFEEKDED